MASDIKVVFEAETAPIDRAVRLLDNLEAEVRNVDRALAKNLITEKQHATETEKLNKSIQRLNTAAKGSAKDFRAFEKSMYNSGKAARSNEIAMQQAGYQLQDFIVQVQGGTNPLIAFSQQGSQLAGFFAGPWGAAIGLGIAAVGGLGTAFLGARGDTEDFHEELANLLDYINDNAESTAKLLEMSFSGPLEKARQDAISVLDIFRKMENTKVKESVAENLLPIVEQLSDVFDGLDEQRTATRRQAGGSKITREFVLPEQQRDFLAKQQKQITGVLSLIDAAQKGPVKDLGIRLADAFVRLEEGGLATKYIKEQFKGLLEEAGLMDDVIERLAERDKKLAAEKKARDKELADYKKKKADEQLAREQAMDAMMNDIATGQAARDKDREKQLLSFQQAMDASMNDIATGQAARDKKAKDAAEEKARKEQKLKEIYEEELMISQQQIALQRTIAKYGAEAFEVERLRNRQELERYAFELKRQGLSQENVKHLLAEKAAAIGLKQEMSEIAALASFKLAFAPTARVAAAMEKYAGRGSISNKDPESGETGDSIYKAGSTSETAKEALDKLIQEAKHRQKLATLTDKQARAEELLFELQQTNADKRDSLSEKEVKSYYKKLLALQETSIELERQKEQYEELGGYIIDTFADSFMSIIDGTSSVKDAFRNMAREIISELYKVLIVQRMVNAAKSYFGLPFADGGVFQGGSQLKAFANGGVVGSPTYFPMSGGKTGLMGEAGPEAIMPLKRGKGGKLGVTFEGLDGDRIVVNQTINVSTGVQQTVRTEIKSLMPQIAESAKAAVADAKRRGGSYGKAF